MTKKIFFSILFAVFILLGGCSTSTSPTIPATPLQNASYWNDILANANNVMANTIISLNEHQFISTQAAGAILRINYNVATDQEAITSVLNSTQSLTAVNIAQIKVYLTNLGQQCNTLIADGTAGISDPASKQKYLVDVSTVSNIVQAFLSSLS